MNINVSTGSGNDFNEVCRFDDYHKSILSARTTTTAVPRLPGRQSVRFLGLEVLGLVIKHFLDTLNEKPHIVFGQVRRMD